MPHSRIAVGFFLQIDHVYRFHKYPGRLASVLGDDEIHSDIIAVLCLIDQRMDGRRLSLKEVKVFTVEEGGSDEHHGVLVTVPGPRCLQFKTSVTIDTGRSRDVFSRYKSYNLIRKLLKRGGKEQLSVAVLQRRHRQNVYLSQKMWLICQLFFIPYFYISLIFTP